MTIEKELIRLAVEAGKAYNDYAANAVRKLAEYTHAEEEDPGSGALLEETQYKVAHMEGEELSEWIIHKIAQRISKRYKILKL